MLGYTGGNVRGRMEKVEFEVDTVVGSCGLGLCCDIDLRNCFCACGEGACG